MDHNHVGDKLIITLGFQKFFWKIVIQQNLGKKRNEKLNKFPKSLVVRRIIYNLLSTFQLV